jgi:hypothetical protein
MGADWKKFLAVAAPFMLLASVSSAHAILFSWTSIFSNIWNSIWNSIASILHIQTTSAQQQFADRLGELQANETSLARFYLANVGKYAKQYNVSVNTSWAVRVTDVNSTTSPVIGRLTAVWNQTSQTLGIYDGIVNTTGIPTFWVNVTHSSFMSLTKDAIDQSVYGAVADIGIAEATHSVSYGRVG